MSETNKYTRSKLMSIGDTVCWTSGFNNKVFSGFVTGTLRINGRKTVKIKKSFIDKTYRQNHAQNCRWARMLLIEKI